jgi:cytochrome b
MFFRALERAEQEHARLRQIPTDPVGDRGSVWPAAPPRGLEQLKLVFDYSKFQIRLYTMVAVVFAAAFAFQPRVFKLHRGFLGFAVVLICLAGLAAGIIASRCAYFSSRSELWAAKIGPFRWNCLRSEYWIYIQHACFGLALIAALFSVFSGDGKWLSRRVLEAPRQQPQAERGEEHQDRAVEGALVESVLKSEADREARQGSAGQP